MTLRIYGQSDDLVEISGQLEDEVGCYNQRVTFEVGTEKEGIRVIVEYAPPGSKAGVWRIAVEPWDEDVPVFDCDMRMGPSGYSMELSIDCPDATPVKWTKTAVGR